ncbi:MAG: exosortase system-associated protein, TIGR04073 family [Candidatus Omnitrophota bacterium]
MEKLIISKRLFIGVLAIAFMAAYAVCGFAQEAENAGEKLADGVKDTATGWTEVPKEMVETSEETNVVEGVTVGTIKGAGKAVVKTAKGVVKAATFIVPDKEGEEEEKEAE